MKSIQTTDQDKTHNQTLVALALVLLPNIALIGVGLLMRGPAQQVLQNQAEAAFDHQRFLRQVGLQVFMLLPMGTWLWRRKARWSSCGWGREGAGRALGLGILLGAGALALRGPFAPEWLTMPGTRWALATYAVVVAAEETLYRGFLQRNLEIRQGRWLACLTTALLFTIVHVPARLLSGQTFANVLIYTGGADTAVSPGFRHCDGCIESCCCSSHIAFGLELGQCHA